LDLLKRGHACFPVGLGDPDILRASSSNTAVHRIVAVYVRNGRM
jgi:hypothetical protein